MKRSRIVTLPLALRRAPLWVAVAGICAGSAAVHAQSLVSGIHAARDLSLARQDQAGLAFPTTRSDAPADPDVPYVPLYTPTAPFAELDDLFEPKSPSVDVGQFEYPLDFALAWTNRLEEKTGLRVGLAYTMIFQQASGGPGVRNGGSGDLDLMFDWALIGRGTPDVGRFIFTVEERFKIGSDPASAVGPGVGALTNTTGGFNDRGTAIRDVFWSQSLFDNRFRAIIGRMDISDYVGGYRLQSINNSFSNRAFSALASASFPGHGFGALFTLRPTDQLYVTAGASNAYGRSTTSTIDRLVEDWDLFYTGEVGFTPTFEGLGRGRYAAMVWHVATREDPDIGSDTGFTLIAEQDLTDRFYAFARYQFADNALERIDHSYQIGGAINGLLGSPQNITGLAFSYADAIAGLRDEKVAELFHRWQLTRFTQFSVGAQLILDPSNAPDDDAIGVFTARLRIAF